MAIIIVTVKLENVIAGDNGVLIYGGFPGTIDSLSADVARGVSDEMGVPLADVEVISTEVQD